MLKMQTSAIFYHHQVKIKFQPWRYTKLKS